MWRITVGEKNTVACKSINLAKRMKELEQENSRLKKIVADLSLDNAILKEVSKGNF